MCDAVGAAAACAGGCMTVVAGDGTYVATGDKNAWLCGVGAGSGGRAVYGGDASSITECALGTCTQTPGRAATFTVEVEAASVWANEAGAA